MKKVAIYIRVSTQEQAKEGYSIPAQKDKLLAYCTAKNWSIYDVYIDGGFSGGNINRPALKELLDNLDNFDIVLVYKLDRLSRSQKDTLHLIEDEFLNKNVDFVSLLEAFDTTSPFGKAMIGILSVFAQLERETIKQRAKLGKERRAKEGLWRGGAHVPTGYIYLEDKEELKVDEYEALQIKEIFHLYGEGKGYKKIADILNAQGYRKKNGGMWHINAIKRILTNPVYKGFIKYKGEVYPGNHKGIVNEKLYDETQILIKKRSTNSFPSSKYLLGGMIWCGYCGARMKGTWITRYKNGPKHYYYICYSSSGTPTYMIKDPDCPGKHIPMEKVDEYIISNFKNIHLDRNKLINIHNKHQKSKTQSVDTKILKDKIKSIENQISKLMNLYQYEHIPSIELSQRIEPLYKDKDKIQKTLQKNCKPIVSTTNIGLDEILEYIDKIDLIWKEANFEEKRILLKDFIDKIYIKNDDISIKWKDIL
ncbi:recombinase family protein [Clostridium sp. D2Q-11]|uniref:Recombinase family protein n=1 Tax=Anaeromonas frigoriresistens TaxID=2683708 RepID=A0A942Z8G4_9FIRM|nr:recombinase family protein [Anaeromonas frigoriresistens]MBS4538253.1 recombinase family protein [Anaeromonas frigoriresistens]